MGCPALFSPGGKENTAVTTLQIIRLKITGQRFGNLRMMCRRISWLFTPMA